MSRSVQRALPPMEVDRVHKPKMLKAGTVNKVQYDEPEAADPLENARISVGAAIKHGIGDDPLKTYGTKSQMSGLVSGENVPDYLARIYENPSARRRFARALLADDDAVRVRTVIEWDEEKAG